MPRPPRRVIPGVPLHVTQRGNDRVRTFHRDEDYERFRHVLGEASLALGVEIHAYVFMPNHAHLLLTPPDVHAPARLMQRLGARYVRHVNTVYGRTGTLWEGRYRSALVDSDRHLLACLRYIELNPVRSGIAKTAETFRWSSYRFHALGEADPLLSPHALYLRLGASPVERRAAYLALCQRALGPDVLHAIRSASRAVRARVASRAGTEFDAPNRRLIPSALGSRPGTRVQAWTGLGSDPEL